MDDDEQAGFLEEWSDRERRARTLRTRSTSVCFELTSCFC